MSILKYPIPVPHSSNQIYRKDEIKELKEKLENNSIINVYGELGVGKLSMVAEYSREYSTEYENIIYFSDFFYSTYFYRQKLEIDTGKRDLKEFFSSEERSKNWLIVVMNHDEMSRNSLLEKLKEIVPVEKLMNRAGKTTLVRNHLIYITRARDNFIGQSYGFKLSPFSDEVAEEYFRSKFSAQGCLYNLKELNSALTRGNPLYMNTLAKYLIHKKTICDTRQALSVVKGQSYQTSNLPKLISEEICRSIGEEVFQTFIWLTRLPVDYSILEEISRGYYPDWVEAIKNLFKLMINYGFANHTDDQFKKFQLQVSAVETLRTRSAKLIDDTDPLNRLLLGVCSAVDKTKASLKLYTVRQLIYYLDISGSENFGNHNSIQYNSTAANIIIKYVKDAQKSMVYLKKSIEYFNNSSSQSLINQNIKYNFFHTAASVLQDQFIHRYQESNEYFQRAIDQMKKLKIYTEEKEFAVALDMAFNYIQLGQPNQAIDLCTRASKIYMEAFIEVKLKLDRTKLLLNFGLAYLSKFDIKRAIAYGKQAIDHDKTKISPLVLMVKCYYYQGDFKTTDVYMKKIYSSDLLKQSPVFKDYIDADLESFKLSMANSRKILNVIKLPKVYIPSLTFLTLGLLYLKKFYFKS